MRLVDLVAIRAESSTGFPVVILREHDEPNRLLPILIGASEAAAIAVAATGFRTDRPLTHDVMAELVERLHGRLETVEVTDLRDGTFVADLTLRTPAGEQHLDSRPSDAIALAVRLHAPMFVSEHVLDEAGTAVDLDLDVDVDADGADDDTDHADEAFRRPAVDPSSIDEEVARFRAELAHLDLTELEDLDDLDETDRDDGSGDQARGDPESDG
ncbi:MAG: bifunctional nuclease family protein [Ilumatobacter sp.]|uniref:bifunctional nuclease family protein n=1 Tax=Ilumatobacter sp. TaxID=1967498 RepID=UPI0026268BF7|nr:bifunctional nuclease family protein [Ilumatobacter sp.]MDJ0771368.1 bifunctional nuclease family protein [Ilumatobacter sp.]